MFHHKIWLAQLLVALAVVLVFAPTIRAAAGTYTVAPMTLISGSSPFAGCSAGSSTGTNYLNAEAEPWVEVNPTNPQNIIAVYQQDRWSDGGARGLVASVTYDGGSTWTRHWAHFSQCAGGNAANGGDYDRASDPWVTFAPNGDAYQIALTFNALDATNGVLVSKSSDGGTSWSEPVTLMKDTNGPFNDKESITADPFDSRYVYAVWDRGVAPAGALINPENVPGLGGKQPVMFARTTDGGTTWEPAKVIYDPGANNFTLGNQIVVLPDGTLIDFFTEILSFRNDDHGTQFDASFSLIRSIDHGATWTHGPAIRASKIMARGAYDPDTGRPIRAEGFIGDVAVDRTSGTLYAAWQDTRFSGVDEIALALSRDGGTTWSTPVKVSQTPRSTNPGNQQAFVPAVHVAADGTVAVTYYDFRNNTSAPGAPTDYWMVVCHPSATTTCANSADWQNENRLTTASFDIEQAPSARGPYGYFVGDYEGLTSSGTNFLPVFVQVNNGNPGNRTDVFMTKVSPLDDQHTGHRLYRK